ncbi:MAG: AAA family ATPase [Propioniciclava sp.]
MIRDTVPAMTPGSAAWVQELDLSVPITAQYVLTGNVHDLHLRADGTFAPTVDVVTACLVANDYDLVYRFTSLEGIWLEHVGDGVVSNSFFPDSHLNRASVGALAKLADLLLHTAGQAQLRVALIIESGSTIWGDADQVEAGRLLLASRRLANREVWRVPGGNRIVPPANTIVWIADAENDAPDWLRHSDSTRTLRIPLPSLSVRRAAAGRLLEEWGPDAPPDPGVLTIGIAAFAETTQGVTLRAMRSIATLARDQQTGPDRIEEAVRSYLAGVVDSPWQDPHLLERIRDAEAIVERRVLGQPHAVRRALDILRRSALGLTGAHHGRSGTRPQGILFFAGPTGVGKTELAKTLAEVLFGAEDAYVRFDMSEFSAEHSEARLIGAPPGYIGHREGGELTNAVRERPFTVILFDEIEKAHPRILDKFLQILDDGRLTDGSGETVHFSESVIIFTSNLGASAALHDAVNGPEVTPSPEQAAATILATIQRHFTDELQRPELLSRMGDNIIVFDAITPEVGATLVAKYLAAVVDTVAARLGTTLVISERAHRAVEEYALTKLPFGGRGIGTAVETALVNPLARSLASADRGQVVQVSKAVATAHGWEVSVEVSPGPDR